MGLPKPIQQLQSEFAERARQFARHDSAIGLALNEVLRTFVAGSACHARKLICQFLGSLGETTENLLPHGKALASRPAAVLISINPWLGYSAHPVGQAEGNSGANSA